MSAAMVGVALAGPAQLSGVPPACLGDGGGERRAVPGPRLMNRADRIANAAAGRSRDEMQVLGFTPRDFVIFGVPYKNPGSSPYVRKNGAQTFWIMTLIRFSRQVG